jgi:hypothetical protein
MREAAPLEAAFRMRRDILSSCIKDIKLEGVNVACEAEVYFEWNDGDGRKGDELGS